MRDAEKHRWRKSNGMNDRKRAWVGKVEGGRSRDRSKIGPEARQKAQGCRLLQGHQRRIRHLNCSVLFFHLLVILVFFYVCTTPPAPRSVSERYKRFNSKSIDPLWACDNNGCGLWGSGSGLKQGNAFLVILSGHCTCSKANVRWKVQTPKQQISVTEPGGALIPLNYLQRKCDCFSGQLKLFLTQRAKGQRILFVCEQWGKKKEAHKELFVEHIMILKNVSRHLAIMQLFIKFQSRNVKVCRYFWFNLCNKTV